MVTSVARRLSLPVSTVVVTATDPTTTNLYNIANEEGAELASSAPWQMLRKEWTFTTVATESQGTSSLPTDLGFYCQETAWNRTRRQQLIGPLDPMEWQRLKAMTVSPAIDTMTIRGSVMLIMPVPAAGQTIAYEYISDKWCQNAAGSTTYNAWSADTDTGILSERVMGLGIIWRYKKGRGMSWDVEYQQYEEQKADAIASSTMRGIVAMGGGVWRIPPSGLIAPDSNWSP
jgi:hypothetical protein